MKESKRKESLDEASNKEKSPAIKKKLAKKGLSKLSRECSLDAFKHNIRREYHAGQTAQGTQHVAIALSVLKRSCGVDSKDRMTPKEIVAAGGKRESMNVESINVLLVKTINTLQEREIETLAEADTTSGSDKFILRMVSKHKGHLKDKEFKTFKAAEKALKTAIKKDNEKQIRGKGFQDIYRAHILPPGGVNSWDAVAAYHKEKGRGGIDYWWKDDKKSNASQSFNYLHA